MDQALSPVGLKCITTTRGGLFVMTALEHLRSRSSVDILVSGKFHISRFKKNSFTFEGGDLLKLFCLASEKESAIKGKKCSP